MSDIGCEHFTAEVTTIIDRFRKEYIMTYAELIGCLELIKYDICYEAEAGAEEE